MVADGDAGRADAAGARAALWVLRAELDAAPPLAAGVAGLVSMLAFVARAAAEPTRGRATVTTMRIDAVLSAALAVAVGLELAA